MTPQRLTMDCLSNIDGDPTRVEAGTAGLVAPRVHIFWDHSNIVIPARDLASRRDGPLCFRSLRIQVENLFDLARGLRYVRSAVCVGSGLHLSAPKSRIEALGVKVVQLERGRDSGREVAVDEVLQLHMLRTLADVNPPGVAVLLTGDGAGFSEGVGFHADLKRMADVGWGIEVLSWDTACNAHLRAWASKAGVYISLDRYYKEITYVQGGRFADRLHLRDRPYALPGRVNA